jgi:PIN domain nuclease of toxin-antitoxin system
VIVLDTHAWLWWELAMLAQHGQLQLDRGVERWVGQAMANPRVVALDLIVGVAVQAGLLDGARFPGDPADRIIYASAKAWSAPLATRDAALRAYDPRGTVWD